MDLRDFIKQALLDVVDGIKQAQAETPAGTIVPGGFLRNLNNAAQGLSDVQVIDFTVTVTADEISGRTAKLGVVNAIIGAGLASDTKSESSQSNVLRFKVPIQLPTSGSLRPAEG